MIGTCPAVFCKLFGRAEIGFFFLTVIVAGWMLVVSATGAHAAGGMLAVTVADVQAASDVPDTLRTLDPPFFSHPPGFYSEPIALSIHPRTPDEQVRFFYTLDGSLPDTTSAEFTGPLELDDRSAEPNVLSVIPTNNITRPNRDWRPPHSSVRKGHVVRVLAVKPGYAPSYLSGSFFIFEEGRQTYSLPVVSIITDSLHLFSHQTGLYVPGDAYIQGSDGSGNYVLRGEAWERPAVFELYEPDGTLGVSMNIGVRIHGGFSRRFPQKSLRLYARNAYESSDFGYAIFPESEETAYRRLILRNSGNDFGFTMFMDGAAQSLVRHFNLDTQRYRPTVTFINGEYWGIHNLRERYDRHYLARVHGVDPDGIDVLTRYDAVKEGDNSHYRAMLAFAESNDLARPEHYAHMQTMMDTDNYLDYLSAQIYYGNSDWPHNNIDFWRSRNEFDPHAPHGHDGRWRWLLYDVDRSLGYYTPPDFDMVGWVMDPPFDWSVRLMHSMFDSELFFHGLINRMADHLNTAFHPDRVLSVIDSLHAAVEPEIDEQINRWTNLESREQWEANVASMGDYARDRPDYLRSHMQTHWPVGDTVAVSLDVQGESGEPGGHIVVNTTPIHPDTPGVPQQPWPWSGVYFSEVPISLEAVAAPGHSFSHWTVHHAVDAETTGAPADDVNTTGSPAGSGQTTRASADGDPASGQTTGVPAGSDSDVDLSSPAITIHPQQGAVYTAHFVPSDEPEHRKLLHYFVFSDTLANNTPLTELFAVYADRELEDHTPPALLRFEPAVQPYPPEGTAGILDRVNDPTSVNFWAEALDETDFGEVNMRGIRVRNPSLMDDRQSALVLQVPTTGFREPELRMAMRRTSSGQRSLTVHYRLSEDGAWLSEGLSRTEWPVYEVWNELSIDFDGVDGVDDNAQFQVRIGFAGDEQIRKGESGNVRFNNISVTGVSTDVPVFADTWNRRNLEQGGQPQQIRLLQNYPNPFNPQTLIEFEVPEAMQVRLEVFDVLGRRVAVPLQGPVAGGRHTVRFDAGALNLSGGVYVVRLQAGAQVKTRSMMFVK